MCFAIFSELLTGVVPYTDLRAEAQVLSLHLILSFPLLLPVIMGCSIGEGEVGIK